MARQPTESKNEKDPKGESAGAAPPQQGGDYADGQGGKVDSAFELVEQLEKNQGEGAAEKAAASESRKAAPKTSRSGLRVNFSVAALISENDTRSAGDDAVRAGESKLLNFGITLPYIWQIPVVGPTALKVVKYFQKDDQPESLRDVMKSLRRKSKW